MESITITDFGSFLGKHSERLVIRRKDQADEEHALMNIDQIIVCSSGVSLSSDLIAECTERGIEINFLSFSGAPYAKIVSPMLTATVITRREQLSAYNDERSVIIAKKLGIGKIRNQINVVKYFSKYRKSAKAEIYQSLMDKVKSIQKLETELKKLKGKKIEDVRQNILNIEGRAAAIYWECVREILSGKAELSKRKHRFADDAINAALNYGYGVLYSQIWSAITLAGLEPFAGFVHVDRPGKPSLVLDFIEEFRQPVVDRVILAILNKGFKIEPEKKNPDEDNKQFRLSLETRKELAKRVLDRLEDEERFEGKKRKIRHIIQIQAKHLTMFLRGERDYRPFVCSW